MKAERRDDSIILTIPLSEIPLIEKSTLKSQGCLFVDQAKTFQNFVVTPSNKFISSLGNKIEIITELPMYIHGNSGSGKSHLVHAIANVEISRGKNVFLTSVNYLVPSIIDKIRNNQPYLWTTVCAEYDMLIIDDIQEFKNKTTTQETILNMMNGFKEAKKPVIVTSTIPAIQLSGFHDSLVGLLNGSIHLQINAPDYESRIAILKTKAKEREFKLYDDVIEYLAKRETSNIRELEGFIIKLHAVSVILGITIDIENAKEHLN
ncbi:MAG TPA: DnaA/Hda family protein [Bacteriovoracaceae bacterium]|nr:DnaA/Hda family protein [Bacteriovoracaceae bacterium]